MATLFEIESRLNHAGKPTSPSTCLSFRCQLPNNQIVNDQRHNLPAIGASKLAAEAAERTSNRVARSVTAERGAKDNRGGFFRQAELEAFLKLFEAASCLSRVQVFACESDPCKDPNTHSWKIIHTHIEWNDSSLPKLPAKP